jgi:integrase
LAEIERSGNRAPLPDSPKSPVSTGALSNRWRSLFATAVYTGLRKGELLGLRKCDVALPYRLLTVARSYRRETTKSGRADVIPIAAELVPYLEDAIARSVSDLVFPAPDGSMMSDAVQLEIVLRRALHRAGIVERWLHKCRRKGCGHVETAQDDQLRRKRSVLPVADGGGLAG